MGDQEVFERIAAWRAAGLIDEPTAERLRASEMTRAATASAAPAAPAGVGWLTGHGGLSAVEFFGYLGGAFVLAAYYWMVNQSQSGGNSSHAVGLAAAVAAVAFVVIGYVLRAGTGARSRVVGVLLLVGGMQAWWAALLLLDPVIADSDLRAVVASVGWLTLAAVVDRVAAGLPTQAGLLAASSAAAWTTASLAGKWLFPVSFDDEARALSVGPLEPLLLFAWFVIIGAALGWFAEREAAMSTTDPSRWRRMTLTRFWAAMTVIVGASAAVMGWGFVPGRSLEPVLGDALLLVAAGAIAFVALRVGSFAYMLPVGLGVFIALTDLNGSYVVDSTGWGPALLLEGLVLIGVGVGIELLRRRLAGRARTVGAAAAHPEEGAVP